MYFFIMTKIFQHRWPVREDDADSSFLVRIQPDDLYGDEYELEEIPAQALGDNRFRVCAIPLLVHDTNLDDVIKADAKNMYAETITDSGRFGFRLGINVPDNHKHEEVAEFTRVIKKLKKKDCNIEFFSHVLIAVDASDEKNASKLSSMFEKMVKKKWLIAYDTVRL
jgi:hypothetical protein